MLICIRDVLSPEERAPIVDALSSGALADGRATAGPFARDVKNNLQLTVGAHGHEALQKIVHSALQRHPVFQIAARPKRISSILFNRYDQGMSYGNHVDNPSMNGTRTDVSFTLFLSDPDSYDGGELVVRWGEVEHEYKLPAGGLIAYPSGTLHRVADVTRGARIAAVGWVQSEIRDPGQREILFDLDCARQRIFARDGKSEVFDLVTKTWANLMRTWGDF